VAPESSLRVTGHSAAVPPSEGARPSFFFDLGDPESYLAAERVRHLLPLAEWVPVAADGLPEGRLAERPGRRIAIEALAAKRGVQPLRWPARWPGETRRALVVATYAKQVGLAAEFSLAAFRQAFAGGRDLADDETLLHAAASCEVDASAVAQALAREAVLGAALDLATAAAVAAGVRRVPALVWEGQVFHGDVGVDVLADMLEVAHGRAAAIAAALARRPAP
jgi:2-hydroxychromene-2-carboxylate isomerase